MSQKEFIIHILKSLNKPSELTDIYKLARNNDLYTWKIKEENINSTIRSRLCHHLDTFYKIEFKNKKYWWLTALKENTNIVSDVIKNNKNKEYKYKVLFRNYLNNLNNTQKSTKIFIKIITSHYEHIKTFLIDIKDYLPKNIDSLAKQYNFEEEFNEIIKLKKRIEKHKKLNRKIKSKKINQKFDDYLNAYHNNDENGMLYAIETIKLEDSLRWNDFLNEITTKNLKPTNFNELIKKAENYIISLDKF